MELPRLMSSLQLSGECQILCDLLQPPLGVRVLEERCIGSTVCHVSMGIFHTGIRHQALCDWDLFCRQGELSTHLEIDKLISTESKSQDFPLSGTAHSVIWTLRQHIHSYRTIAYHNRVNDDPVSKVLLFGVY